MAICYNSNRKLEAEEIRNPTCNQNLSWRENGHIHTSHTSVRPLGVNSKLADALNPTAEVRPHHRSLSCLYPGAIMRPITWRLNVTLPKMGKFKLETNLCAGQN